MPDETKVQKLPEVEDENDREIARETEMVRPKSDAPSRAGVTGPGSGADAESG